MIPTENYLPEWRLYLLKKLTLDSKKLSGRPLTTANFLYVTDQEVKDAVMESLQQEMKFLESIPNRIYAGEKIQVTSDSIAFNKGYTPPEFKSLEIIKELIELSGEPDASIKLIKIQISSQYFAIQEKKRIASISSGTWKKGNAESLPMTPIEVTTLKSILSLSPNLADYIVFQLEIDPVKIEKNIQGYLDDFNRQKLIPPKGQRYVAVDEQKIKFLTAIGVLEKRFGKANISTNFTEIIQIVGRENWREESCRFYETLFLLEREGVIKIIDLRGLEVVFSVIQNPKLEKISVEPFDVEKELKFEAFDIEKEFAKVKKIKNPTEHGIVQERWLNVKFILGEIGRILPPIKSKLPQSLSLNTFEFSENQVRVLPYVMEYLLDIGGVELPSQSESMIVITSEPLRRVLSGEFAIIGNQDAIDEYISQVYELCNLIEEDARAKFSEREAIPIPESSKINEEAEIKDDEKQGNDTAVFDVSPGTSWRELIIKFKDEQTVEAYKGTKYLGAADFKRMGFGSRKPDQRWRFLYRLANIYTTSPNKDPNDTPATIDDIARSLLDGVSDQKRQQILTLKTQLASQLRKAFGINDEPFEDYDHWQYYKTKFELKPEPDMRNDKPYEAARQLHEGVERVGSDDPYFEKMGNRRLSDEDTTDPLELENDESTVNREDDMDV